ncbi:hypothetical protein [Streptomyces cellulosae]|uniref:Secreted protein n=1 Tax=Streptomyces cellulosae TaxID=1968 RepID=A0ABW7Y3L3_STRCE
MGQRGRHAAPAAGMQKVRRVAAVVLTAGALVSAGTGVAFADVLEDVPLSGDENLDQVGGQNLACNNSARLVRFNVAETEHHERVCVDRDGHSRRKGSHDGGALAVGDTTLGPQVNAAQAGDQNLYCGNSADVVTVNVTGDMYWDTTCVVTDPHDPHRGGGHRHGAHPRDARALGGTATGPEINSAQTGNQNLYCGNSADTLTVNALGSIRKNTTCTAAEDSSGVSGDQHRGRALVRPGEVDGPETNTAQNGKQNQACGSPGSGLDVPLGPIERQTTCTAYDGA